MNRKLPTTKKPSADKLTQPYKDRARKLPPQLRNAPIYNYLVNRGRLREFALKVDNLGIKTFGDFVACGEEQIYRRIRTTRNNKRRVRELLAAFDL